MLQAQEREGYVGCIRVKREGQWREVELFSVIPSDVPCVVARSLFPSSFMRVPRGLKVKATCNFVTIV